MLSLTCSHQKHSKQNAIKFLIGLFIGIGLFIDLSTARAGPWEQAEQAYDNGDYEQAIRLWRQMANQKDPRAQNQLGEMYSKGRGVRRDFSQAEFWFERSAHQGYSDAQYNLASLHRSGRGVRKDPKKAAKWFLEAAKQGHIKAQYNLGVMYENGWGVDRDSEKAAFWYQKAAAQDYELAGFFPNSLFDSKLCTMG